MIRLVKVIDNKYIQIKEYRNPNICFNTNKYDNLENYCTLKEEFDPFELFFENQELKKVIDKAKLYIKSTKYSDINGLENHSIKEFWFIEELLNILNEVK